MCSLDRDFVSDWLDRRGDSRSIDPLGSLHTCFEVVTAIAFKILVSSGSYGLVEDSFATIVVGRQSNRLC